MIVCHAIYQSVINKVQKRTVVFLWERVGLRYNNLTVFLDINPETNLVLIFEIIMLFILTQTSFFPRREVDLIRVKNPVDVFFNFY